MGALIVIELIKEDYKLPENAVTCTNMPDKDGKFRRIGSCCNPQPEICKQVNGDFDENEN